MRTQLLILTLLLASLVPAVPVAAQVSDPDPSTPNMTPGEMYYFSPPQDGMQVMKMYVPAEATGALVTAFCGEPSPDQDPTACEPLLFGSDYDLYLRVGAAPTTETNDCASAQFGSNEACNVLVSDAWVYVGVYAYLALDGAYILAGHDGPDGGLPVSPPAFCEPGQDPSSGCRPNPQPCESGESVVDDGCVPQTPLERTPHVPVGDVDSVTPVAVSGQAYRMNVNPAWDEMKMWVPVDATEVTLTMACPAGDDCSSYFMNAAMNRDVPNNWFAASCWTNPDDNTVDSSCTTSASGQWVYFGIRAFDALLDIPVNIVFDALGEEGFQSAGPVDVTATHNGGSSSSPGLTVPQTPPTCEEGQTPEGDGCLPAGAPGGGLPAAPETCEEGQDPVADGCIPDGAPLGPDDLIAEVEALMEEFSEVFEMLCGLGIDVSGCNAAPVADAGPDANADEGTSVTLDGSGSSDADGTIASYAWVQTAGTTVTLTGGDTDSPSFTAPMVGVAGETLTFELTVTDDAGATGTDTVDITVDDTNVAPTADAGADQTVDEGSNVTLDGSASSDPEGGVTYAWEQTAGTTVTLTGADTAGPNFTAPMVPVAGEMLTFKLTVTDTDGLTDEDTVNITVEDTNVAPVADAGADQSVLTGATVTLDGSGSSDDAGIASYQWNQTAGDSVTLSDDTAVAPTFTATSAGTLTFQLTVTDADGLNDTDSVDIVISEPSPEVPNADAGPDQEVDEGTEVTLDGGGSSDPNGDPITFAWAQTAGPNVTLSDDASAMPTFTAPDVVGDQDLIFELTVADDSGNNDTDSVTISVKDLTDGDGDGVRDVDDNCPAVANDGQDDLDDDGEGDACDDDIDGDGVANDDDAFPNNSTESSDFDGDGIGDNADTDDDNDGEPDVSDNCPLAANADQADLDDDGVGDACDDDRDGDGVDNDDDAFPDDANESADSDNDGVGDNADACPDFDDAQDLDEDGIPDACDDDRDGDGVNNDDDLFPDDSTQHSDSDGDGVGDGLDQCEGHDDNVDFDNDGTPDGCDDDLDGDGVPNSTDKCPAAWDPDQPDRDNDGLGDACDNDRDGDGVANDDDAFPDDPTETVDTDGDGTGDNSDPDPNDPTKKIDTDGDGLADSVDNCREVANAGQEDVDGDGLGDACDDNNNDGDLGDLDGDGFSNKAEREAGSSPTDPKSTPNDLDGDGWSNAEEEAAGTNIRDASSKPSGLTEAEAQLQAELKALSKQLGKTLRGTTSLDEGGNATVTLRFKAPSGASGLQVLRSQSPYTVVATLPATATTFVDDEAKVGGKYMLVAYKSGNVGKISSDPAAELPYLVALEAEGLYFEVTKAVTEAGKTTFYNGNQVDENVTVTVKIFDADGKLLRTETRTITVPAHGSKTFAVSEIDAAGGKTYELYGETENSEQAMLASGVLKQGPEWDARVMWIVAGSILLAAILAIAVVGIVSYVRRPDNAPTA